MWGACQFARRKKSVKITFFDRIQQVLGLYRKYLIQLKRTLFAKFAHSLISKSYDQNKFSIVFIKEKLHFITYVPQVYNQEPHTGKERVSRLHIIRDLMRRFQLHHFWETSYEKTACGGLNPYRLFSLYVHKMRSTEDRILIILCDFI